MAILSGLIAALGTGATAGATTAGATAGAAATATNAASVAGGIGAVAGLAGTGAQFVGMMQANAAAQKQQKIQQAQMNLESTRQRRSIVRNALIQRGDALSTATNQGASDSSGLFGSLGQIRTEQGMNIAGVNAGQDLGNAAFAAARDQAQGQTLASIGSGISSLGGALVKNQEPIGRLATYYGTV